MSLSYKSGLKFIYSLVIVLNFFASNAYSIVDGVKIEGERTLNLPVVDGKENCSAYSDSKTCKSKRYKKLKFHKIKLNNEFKHQIQQKLYSISDSAPNSPNNHQYTESTSSSLNVQVDLGMNNVPVLDQGSHGTCATFAVTAFLNAYKNVGDYISQQCLLELGNFEETSTNGLASSGWDGNNLQSVISRINLYGVMSKTECPHTYAHKSYIMDPQQYYSYSKGRWAHDFYWQELYTITKHGKKDHASIDQVKLLLDHGRRLLIGSLLIADQIIGKPINGLNHGFWDLPPHYDLKQFIKDQQNDEIIGHALIIIGYDDQLKLFKVRNSWGARAGDNGDFYMSYKYFDVMTIETIEIY